LIWTIEITKNAAKQFKKLDKVEQKRIYNFLTGKLENTDNPRKYGKALKGKQGELWRYRIGDYRIICKIQDSQLTIVALAIAHRKEVYR